MATGNAINANTAGIVGYNGSGTFTGTAATNHAVLVGGASSSTITNLAVGSNGQVLVGATGADPAFATLTSSDSSITFTTGANTLSLQVAGGTTVGKTITGDSGGALSPTAGNWNLLGSGSITTSGSGSTLTTQLTGLTNHAVLVGAGTSTITKLAVGTTGQLLVGATGADPAFGSSASADFTFTTATASTTRTLTVSNTDNTSGTSNALSQITTGGGASGDPFQTFTVTGATNWSQGIDNSDSDKYKVSASTALGTTDVIVATTGGAVTMPLKPAFNYYNSSTRSNVTGDGTSYTLIFNSAASTQQGSGFDGTSTFTAPVTGWYHFDLVVTLTGIVSQTQAYITITHTGIQTYYGPSQLASATASGGALALNMSRTFKMTAADTVTCTAVVAGSTKTVGVDASAVNTGFQGYLVC